MPHKKNKDKEQITITFTVDPALRTTTEGQRYMDVRVLAKQGDLAQLSGLQVTNWNTDLPDEIDRLMRLFLNGEVDAPNFPSMEESPAPPEPEPAQEPEPVIEDQPQPEQSYDLDEDYEVTIYGPDGDVQQNTLF